MAFRPGRIFLKPLRALEAERKFNPSALSVKQLMENSGSPPFHTLSRLEDTTFEDRYYDFDNKLFKAGIWIRQRNREWEAKQSHGGDFTNSHFEEFSGEAEVRRLLVKHLGGVQSECRKQQMGLDMMARFVTRRKAWRANDRFNIVIDETDFGHCVGEIELTKTLTMSAGQQHQQEGSETEITTRMHDELIAVMAQYPWAFPKGDVKGKLSAYFALQHGKTLPLN